MILETLVGLAMQAEPTPDAPTTTAAHSREWAVNRPNRGAHSRTIRDSSVVPARWRPFAACVENRESHGNPKALNASGAAGLFQFMPPWRASLPYVISQRLGRFGAPPAVRKAVRTYLFRVHYIEKYPAIYQRIAFAEVIDDGLWHHWTLPGSRCQGLVPR
jgi:hypothetical protein